MGNDMWLIFSRVILTIVIAGILIYALFVVWTKNVDVRLWLKSRFDFIPIKEESLIVTPDKYHLITKDWGKLQVFEVKNLHTTKTFYSVWIKIWSKDKKLSTLDFDISPKNDNYTETTKTGLKFNYEIVITKAHRKEDGISPKLILLSFQAH